MIRRWRGPVAWALTLALAIVALSFVAGLMHPKYAFGMTKALTASQVRGIIRDEAKRAGLGKADTAALVELARRESTWHAASHSTRSECHGVLQLSKGMAHGHAWWDPAWNTRRAIRYIRFSTHRYRTPRRALAHSRRYGWY